jgi:hypothetical protein
MRSVGLIVALVGLVTLTALIVVWTRDNGKLAELHRTPGYNLEFPDGEVIDRGDLPAGGNAGARHGVRYTTTASDDEIVAFFDPRLADLGYHRVAIDDFPVDTRSTILRSYERETTRYYVVVSIPPVRVSGREVDGPFRVLSTTIEN